MAERPYRKGKPDGFREIHRELANTVKAKRPITLMLLENQPEKADRNRRKR